MSSRNGGASSGAPPLPKRRRRKPRRPSAQGAAADLAIVAWVGQLRHLGYHRSEIQEAARTGTDGFPREPQAIADGTMQRIYAALDHQVRLAGEMPPSRKKRRTDSGPELRTLYAERKAGADGDLFQVQIAIMEAVRTLEAYELPELDWSETTQDYVSRIYDYLSVLEKWMDGALQITTAQMSNIGRQRKLQALWARAEDPSSTPNERANAARLAEKLARQVDPTQIAS
jgi:hypothetical protein